MGRGEGGVQVPVAVNPPSPPPPPHTHPCGSAARYTTHLAVVTVVAFCIVLADTGPCLLVTQQSVVKRPTPLTHAGCTDLQVNRFIYL